MTSNKLMPLALSVFCTTAAFGITPGALYGVDAFSGELIQIDLATGIGTLIGNTGIQSVGLSFNQNGQAFARDFNNLFDLNISNGSVSNSRISGDSITALEYSLDFSSAFSIHQFNRELFSIDTTTGTATTLGTVTGVAGAVLGLALNRNTGSLFVGTNSSEIIEVSSLDASTLSITHLTFSEAGEFGLSSIATDSNNNLYGVGFLTDNLFSIDLSTGVATSIGFLGSSFEDVRGLAFSTIPAPSSILPIGLLLIGAGRRRS